MQDNRFTLHNGDSLEVLKQYPDNHFDSVVTDPPYGIAFLGRDWDSKKATESTTELTALSNLPLGMRLTSLQDDIAFQDWIAEIFAECCRVLKPGGHLLAFSAARTYHHTAMAAQRAGFEIRDQIMWVYSSGFPKSQDVGGSILRSRQLDDSAAAQWTGWGTALKPAHEPVVMARKPSGQSVAATVLKYGTGAINIDACRIGYSGGQAKDDVVGRFPSNVVGELGEYQKYFYCPKVTREERHAGYDLSTLPTTSGGKYDTEEGGALGRQDIWKDGNHHPTVKPQALMSYLVELVTPPGGRVLDPFNGSGSTGMAAVKLGHHYTGIDLDPAYIDIAQKRIVAWSKEANTYSALFEEVAK